MLLQLDPYTDKPGQNGAEWITKIYPGKERASWYEFLESTVREIKTEEIKMVFFEFVEITAKPVISLTQWKKLQRVEKNH